LSAALERTVADLEEVDAARPTPTQFPQLDARIGGLLRGEYSVLAGRFSAGVQIVAGQLSASIAAAEDSPGVLYAALDTPPRWAAQTLLCADARVPESLLGPKKVGADARERLLASARRLDDAHLYFAASRADSIAAIHATADALRASLMRQGVRLALIVVDHVELLRPSAEVEARCDHDAVRAETAAGLRFLAIRHECHVLALAVFPPGAPVGRPRLVDVGNDYLVNRAANVLLLKHDRDHQGGFAPDQPDALFVAKARHGASGEISLQGAGISSRAP
jgi:replicative DNA helicase